jgi:hypothetical protein
MGEAVRTNRLAAAVDDMREATERVRLARFQRERVDRAIRELDVLVESIERLNLDEKARVPMAWQPKLAQLAAELPVECHDRLRAGISPLRLLDQVYDVQQELLWMKQGADVDALRRIDGELEHAAAS